MTTVRAESPATVWQVKVQVGDEVTAGQDLIILESMKMEIPVTADVAGRVTEIKVAVDDRVQEGDALAVLE